MTLPLAVSIVVPVRNEELHLRACLDSLVRQDYPGPLEILVVDGRSSDHTRDIVAEFQRLHPHLRCLDNPAGIVPTAMNIGIRSSRADVLIRADGHNLYPPDYVANSVRLLERTGADNVGGPVCTVPAGDSFGARLVAAVLCNPFGVGNSGFRTGGAGFVDTVPFGAFRRSLFDRIGLYDETLVRNQDNELNARIRNAGGRIYLAPELATCYHPVASYAALLGYAYRMSRWHLYTLSRNARALSLRHLAPALFVLGLVALLASAPWSRLAFATVAAFLACYLTAGWCFALRARRALPAPLVAALPLASFGYHFAYGCGILAGVRYLWTAPSRRPLRAGLPVRQP